MCTKRGNKNQIIKKNYGWTHRFVWFFISIYIIILWYLNLIAIKTLEIGTWFFNSLSFHLCTVHGHVYIIKWSYIDNNNKKTLKIKIFHIKRIV